jgi:hypothetical protein
MSVCLRLPNCTHCGDATVHQCNRQMWESSSAFGQHLHDDLPNDFYMMDIDAAIYAHATGILRVIEHKSNGSGISQGQRVVLPKLAAGLAMIDRASVWVVRSDWPFTAGLAAQVMPVQPFTLGDAVPLDGPAWVDFQRARTVVPEGRVP